MSEHADFEALSAFVDGEAPEWADHVAGCEACRGTVERLQVLAAAVGSPVPPAPQASRDRAVDLALDRAGRGHAAERERFARRRVGRRTALPAVAAALVALVGLSGLLALNLGSSDESATVAGPAMESAPEPDALAGPVADSSAAAALPPTDLGDVADAATLVARAVPALPRGAAGSAGTGGAMGGSGGGAGGQGGAASPAAGSGPAARTAPVPGQREPLPRAVGTRPCEEQAREQEPALQELVYFATARRGELPAVVLGFATGPDPAPVTLLLLAQDGCGELLRAAAP